jgi:type I restriction enzyme, S subunit
VKAPLVSIGDVAADLRSGFASGEDDPAGIVQFRMNNVGRNGEINWDKVRRVPRSKAKSELLVQSGDILFNATNSPELVGKTAFFAGFTEPVTFSNHFVRIRSKKNLADPAYVARWLQREFERGRFAGMCRSWVNQASITKEQLASLSFPLPSPDEQRRIAVILDKADTLRRQRKRAHVLLRELSLSLAGECLHNGRESRSIELGDVITEGPTNGLYKPATDYGDGVPILRIDSFYDGRITNLSSLKRLRITESEMTRFRLQDGDLVINRVNSLEYLGKSAIVEKLLEPTVFESNMMRFAIDSSILLPEVCIALLQTQGIKQQILSKAKNAVNQSSINQGDVKSLRLPLPTMTEQRRFLAGAREIESLKAKVVGDGAVLDALFSTLQHRAFSGQL